MKKFALALVSALALMALPAGTASADCPAVGSSGNSTGGSGPLQVDAAGLWVYGEAPLAGYGESDLGTNGTNVTYSGEAAGAAGHGEVENGSVGTSGVSGSADGQAGAVSGSGHVSTADGDASAGGAPVGCVVNVGH